MKMKLSEAKLIAEYIEIELSQYFELLEVVGAVARGEEEVVYLEFVGVPVIEEQVTQQSFVDGMETLAIRNQFIRWVLGLPVALTEDVHGGGWLYRPVNERKEAHHQLRDSGWRFDLVDVEAVGLRGTHAEVVIYMVEERQWSVAVNLGVGTFEVADRLIAFATHRHGMIEKMKLHPHRPVGCGPGCRGVELVEPVDLFDALGLEWVEPELRTVEEMVRVEKLALGMTEGAKWR